MRTADAAGVGALTIRCVPRRRTTRVTEALLRGALALVLLTAGCSPAARGQAPPSSATPDDYATALLAATNDARTAQGLVALDPSDCATGAAAQRAQDLVGAASLEHAPLDPVLDACGPATTAAENLSTASEDPAEVVAAWMSSPGHRANILDPALTEVGVACVPDGGRTLCAEVFLGP